VAKIKTNKMESISAMHKIKKIGFEIKKALEKGKVDVFGEKMHEHWLTKKSITQKMSNPNIDRLYELALNNGALGGKIVGAGGGGFLMLYCPEKKQALRKCMQREGLKEMHFKFDFEGAKVIGDFGGDFA